MALNDPQKVGMGLAVKRIANDADVRIRTAAVKLFARQGYTATGIRDIAKESGLTSATLYHYTSSKEDLLVSIMRSGQQLLNNATTLCLEGVSRPEYRISLLVGGLASTHATNPLSTRVIDTELRSLAPNSPGRQEVVALRDAYEALWTDTLELGVQQQVFDISDVHFTRLALITMCTGMSNWFHPGSEENLRRARDQFVELALGALRTCRGRRRLHVSDVPAVSLDSVAKFPWEPTE